MKKRNILLSSLAVFALSMNQVSALEVEEGWNKVDSGTTSIAVDELTAFEEKLASRVQRLNLSSVELGNNELYRYRIATTKQDSDEEKYLEISNEKSFETEEEANNWAKNNKPEKEGWSFLENIIKVFKLDKIFTKTTYETEKEVTSAIEKFESTIDEDSSTITITEKRDTTGDTTETKTDTQIFYTESEAQKAANGLFVDNHDFKVVATVVKGTPEYDKTVTEDIVITEYFSTPELAQAYIENLRQEGYTVPEPQIVPVTHIEKVAELHRDDYASLTDAQNAYDQFVEDNKNASEGITGAGATSRLNPDKNVVGELVEGTTAYTDQTAVETAKENLPENVEGFIREETETVDQIIHGTGENEVKLVFDTELEALEYIEKLKNQGYDVSEVKKELVSYSESIWKDENGVVVDPGTADGTIFNYTHFDLAIQKSFTEQLADGSTKTVTGTMTLTSVKITNDGKTSTIKMGSQLNYDGQHESGTPKWEYQSVERNNLKVNNKSYIEIIGNVVTDDGRTLPFTVTGYLSESQNICGAYGSMKGYDLVFKSVTIVNGKVLIDSNIVNQYKITGTAVKTQPVWYLDTKTTTLGYDYMVDADAYNKVIDGYNIIGTKSQPIYKDTYQLEITTTTRDYDYEVEGTGTKTYYDVTSKYVKLTDVEWIIESINLGIGGDVEILPPQTGVETTGNYAYLFTMISTILASIILVIKRFI